MISLSEMVVLGRLVLEELAKGGDEGADALQRYTEQFSAFADSELATLGKAEKAELQELSELHAKILQSAQKLQVDTGDSLNKLKGKSRRVMQYLDTRPSRISMSKSHKG